MAQQKMIRTKEKCRYINDLGQGVITYQDTNYVVNGLLEGEEAILDLSTINRKYGNIIELKTKSNDRINVKCPYFLECGGCDLLHMSYEKEISFKKQLVQNAFKKFDRLLKVSDVIKADNPNNYRNKLQMTFKLSKTKKVVSGFYEEGTHKIIPVKNCMIQNELGNSVMDNINLALTKNKILPYDENTHKGVIRHVLIRVGVKTNEVMVVLVTASDLFPGRNNFVKTLLNLDKRITTIIQNVNPRDTSIVLGDKERILYGPGFIYDYLLGFKFKISSKSFYQINPEQTEKLYEKAIELADIKANDVVFDAYSGISTIGIVASKKAKQVICVEQNKDAVKDALLNIKVNRINNVSVFNDDSTEFIKKIAPTNPKIDIVFLDPPRAGSTKEFISEVCKLNPRKIVYISCNYKTLVRDLEYFEGCEIKNIIPVDLFPRTVHVECVVLMSRVEK